MRDLYLLRHAETTANADGTLQGRMDFPLSPKGEEQAVALAPRLIALGFDRVFRSPSPRVLRTLQPALDRGLAAPERDDDLDEIDLGEVSGLSFATFSERYGGRIDEAAYARGEYRFPNGESRRDLYIRAERVWSRIADVDGERVLIASHGGLLSQLMGVILGLPNDGWIRFRFDNAALTKLSWHRGRFFLSRFNDREHLSLEQRSPVFAPRLWKRSADSTD